MRRGTVVMAALGLVVAACGGAEDAASPTTAERPASSTSPPTSAVPSTSEPASAQPVEGWFRNVIELEGVIGRTIPLADPDDLPIVVYERQADIGEMSVRLARCLDPVCAAVDLVDLPTAVGGWLTDAAIRSDGAPVVVMGDDADTLLLVCADPACDAVSEQRFPGANPAAVVVDGFDRPLLVTLEWPDPNVNEALVSLVLCAAPGCAEHRSVELARSEGGIGKVEIGFVPAGAPVIAYEVLGAEMLGTEEMDLVACSDAACTEVAVPEVVDPVGTVPSGLPMFAYVHTASQAVRLVRCLDATCSTAADVEVHREFEGRMFGQLAPLPCEVADGSVVVLVSATPSWSGLERGETGEFFALRCVDAHCDEVLISDAPLASGDESIGVFLDGGLAVATRTALCGTFAEDCPDIESDPPSRLDIRVCRGDGCHAALATVPVDVTTIDASGAPLDGDIVFQKESDVWLVVSGSTDAVNLTETWEFREGGPAWSPDGTRVAFHSDRDDPSGENWDIYAMNRDGSDVTRLTDDPSAEFFPSWSPDGTRIVFSRVNTTDDHRHLVILDLESGAEVQLTDETHNGDIPRWSPDGTRIVFGRRTSGSCEWGEPCNSSIFVIDADGTNEVQLTFADGVHWFPDWSPDGDRIAYHGAADDPLERNDFNIYVVGADGGAVTRLTDYAGTDQSPTWSPDGTQILFQSDRSGTPQLYVMAVDGSEVTTVDGTTGASFGNDWTR